jgi:putative membrane protein insertion efficiency factor
VNENQPTIPARLLVVPIEGYRRFVSPFLGQRCRFAPSCSAYAASAIRTHGALRGLWFAASRVARCHPWNPGGVDPVPPVRSARARDVSDLLATTAALPSSSAMTPGATRCPMS